jgi:peptidyl-dipeptidase Dcp
MLKKMTLCAAAASLLAAASCGGGDKTAENPFFQEWDTPFGVPPFDRIAPEHFMPAYLEGMKRESAEIQAIIDNPEAPGFENVIEAYDRTGEFLLQVDVVFSGLNSANTNDSLQAVDEQVTPLLSRHNNEIAMNPQLFAKIKAVYDQRESLGLDAEQRRLLDRIYKGFERSGANLNDADKARMKEIDEQLSMLALRFGKNLLADTKEFVLTLENKEDLAGLPQSSIDGAARAAAERGLEGKWVFTLDKPSWIPFLQYSTRPDLRETLYGGYLSQGMRGNANDNRQTTQEIARLRSEKARLLGFDTWADFVLDRVMARTPANVYELLDQVWTPAIGRARSELSEMQTIQAAETSGAEFKPSDWWFYAEKLRAKKYDLDENELRPYFSLEAVREGIFTLCNKLYGITFRPIDNAPKYHADNQVYECVDRDGSHLGVLYMDFFPRAGKRGGAWCTSYRPQTNRDGARVAPVSTIVCNFTPPSADQPALLSIDETTTFFHEFGHAIHVLLSRVRYNGLRGTERDFVELPSQIMENWAVAPDFLRLYAKHYQSGETIPDTLIEKMSNSSLFNQGFVTAELTAASILDMDLHTLASYPADFDIMAFQRQQMEKRGLIPQILPRYQYPYFNHIFNGGYAAGYYSYTWSEVLDADAYEAFVETGDLFDPTVSSRFRRLLEQQGSKEGMELYLEFRGREPSRIPLLRNRGLLSEEP